jgi:hypothetical protein
VAPPFGTTSLSVRTEYRLDHFHAKNDAIDHRIGIKPSKASGPCGTVPRTLFYKFYYRAALQKLGVSGAPLWMLSQLPFSYSRVYEVVSIWLKNVE